MIRGDVVLVALSGDYGKPRPSVIIQSDLIEGSDSILVCYLTSDTVEPGPRRISVAPHAHTGLKKSSQIMAEKIFAARRDKCGAVIGHLDAATMDQLNSALAYVTGLMDDEISRIP